MGSSPGLPETEEPVYQLFDLYIGMTDRSNYPEHWVFMLAGQGSDRCTLYHMGGGFPPSSYFHSIETNKPLNHDKLVTREKICSIPASRVPEFRDAVFAVPPHHCQRYVIAVVERLEDKGLVPKGTAARYVPRLQVDFFDGPVRKVSEEEYADLVTQLGEEGARHELCFI
ncbi:hypothetical protein BDW62DRAFT_206107 [Aspergillus aurantiobrunneus]